jgi:hypothetical protein
MMTVKTYTFPTHLKGTTFNDQTFRVSEGPSVDELTPMNLTGARIVMEFKKDTMSRTIVRFDSDDDTIDINDPTNGEFTLKARIIDVCEGSYVSDAIVRKSDGTVKILFQAIFPTLKGVSTL